MPSLRDEFALEGYCQVRRHTPAGRSHKRAEQARYFDAAPWFRLAPTGDIMNFIRNGYCETDDTDPEKTDERKPMMDFMTARQNGGVDDVMHTVDAFSLDWKHGFAVTVETNPCATLEWLAENRPLDVRRMAEDPEIMKDFVRFPTAAAAAVAYAGLRDARLLRSAGRTQKSARLVVEKCQDIRNRQLELLAAGIGCRHGR